MQGHQTVLHMWRTFQDSLYSTVNNDGEKEPSIILMVHISWTMQWLALWLEQLDKQAEQFEQRMPRINYGLKRVRDVTSSCKRPVSISLHISLRANRQAAVVCWTRTAIIAQKSFLTVPKIPFYSTENHVVKNAVLGSLCSHISTHGRITRFNRCLVLKMAI